MSSVSSWQRVRSLLEEVLEQREADRSADKRADFLREARLWYQKGLDIYQDMKSKGTLGSADADKPDEIAREIAKCEAALVK